MPKKAKLIGLGLPANLLKEFIDLSYKGNTSIAPEGYSIDAPLSDSRVKVYAKNGSNDKDIVIVHRGSVGVDDWYDNAKYFALGSVKNTKTYKLHRERQLKAIEKYGANNITGIGHSRAGLYLQTLQKEMPIKEIITYNKAVGFYDMLKTNPKEQTDVKVKNDFVSLLSGLQKRPKPMVEIDATSNIFDFDKAHQPKELEKLGDTFIGLKEDLSEAEKKVGGGRPPKEKSLEELKKVLEKLLKQKEKMDKGKVYKTTNNEKINYDINYTKNRITNYNEKGKDLIVMKLKTTSKTLEKKTEKLLKEYDEIMTPKKKRGRPKKVKEEPKKEEPKKEEETTKEFNAIIFSLKPNMVKDIFDVLGYKVPKYTNNIDLSMKLNATFKTEEKKRQFIKTYTSIKQKEYEKEKKKKEEKQKEDEEKKKDDDVDKKLNKYENQIKTEFKTLSRQDLADLLKKHKGEMTNDFIKELVGKGFNFTKKQLTNIILHKNKVIADLEENAYGGNVMKGGNPKKKRGRPRKGEMRGGDARDNAFFYWNPANWGKEHPDTIAKREADAKYLRDKEMWRLQQIQAQEAQRIKDNEARLATASYDESKIPALLKPHYDRLTDIEKVRYKQFNYNDLPDDYKVKYNQLPPAEKVAIRKIGDISSQLAKVAVYRQFDAYDYNKPEAVEKRRILGEQMRQAQLHPQETSTRVFKDFDDFKNQATTALAKGALSTLSLAETLATPINPLPFSIVDTISGISGVTTYQKDLKANRDKNIAETNERLISEGKEPLKSNVGLDIVSGVLGFGIKEQNEKTLKLARMLENINNSENGTKMVGGAMSEEELAEFNKMKAIIEKQKLENEKLTDKLAKAIEDNETGTARKRKVKSFDAYDILNLNKFLKTQDEVFLNPEVFAYDEDQTAFDKFLKKNPKYYREYQKKFIEDWSVSSQECVILYYGVGSGKTMIAVNCAEQFAVLNPNSSVYFLVPASLVFGTIKEMYRRGIDPTRKNDEGEYIYYFVSYQQFLNTDLIFQPNSLLIVDEIHNLRNFYTMAITEKMSARKWKTTENFSIVGTKLGTTLLLNENKFLRTIFMTGTLFVNSQYDLEPIISIGYKKTPLYKHEKDELDRLMYFDDAFKQYYQGLISYYKIPEDNKEFPSTKYHFEKVEYVASEAYELTPYKAKQIIQKGKKLYDDFDDDIVVKDKEYTYGDLKNAITTGEFADLINDLPDKDAYLMRSRNESIVAKGRWIVNFLRKHNKEKTIIYSQFKGYTLEPLYKIINKDFKELKYGVIDGSLNATEKKIVMDKYNNDEINVLFFTLSIKEGISFKETNNVIINEPYWNYAILEQIIARALRLDSHKKGNKSIVNIHFLVGVKGEEEDIREKEWFKEATDIMNTGIKKLTYKKQILKNNKGQEVITFITMDKYMNLYGISPDIKLYNIMFNKQEGINVFEKKLLEQPRFENVNDNENNEFIKTYNLALLEMPDLTNKQRIVMKRKMYKDFYEENIKEVNKRLQRFNEDTKFRINRNPDLTEKMIIDDKTDNIDVIRKMIKQNKSLTEIITKLGGVDKQLITTFQANFTPKSEVDLLINYSGIKEDKRDNLRILEPTAGIGNVIRGLVNMPIGSNMFIDCNELNNTFYNIGSLYFEGIDNIKWSNVDFMNLTARVSYDYILGNPPFNIRTQKLVFDKTTKIAEKVDTTYHDIDFVAKAFNMLGNGGVLCMIISDRYLRDKSLPKFDIFNRHLEKYIPNHEVFEIKGGFKQDETTLKEMETSTGMICIKLIKTDKNVKIDLENTNFLYNRENPAEIEQYEKIKKGQLKEKKELTKQAKNIAKKIDIDNITKKKEQKKKEEPKKEEPQNIKMTIEEPKKVEPKKRGRPKKEI